MTVGRPCRFCASAVTLATHTCIWLRVQVVGGLSSAAGFPATVSRTLPLLYILASDIFSVMHALTEEEGALAVRVARRVLENSLGSMRGELPALPPVFLEKRGVFVTLTRNGELRGCIGYPYPTHPLKEALCDAAISAATRDPRFPPVRHPELPLLRIEVTVLSPPKLLTVDPEGRPVAVEVGKHGLIVQGYGRSGLLLPQVPIEWGWDSREFLDHTCMKAGLPSGCWRRKEVELFTFEGQIFGEE